jgi:hypothetical protein
MAPTFVWKKHGDLVDFGFMNVTVRFTFRGGFIRIIGAGYWRKGKAGYEAENHLHG